MKSAHKNLHKAAIVVFEIVFGLLLSLVSFIAVVALFFATLFLVTFLLGI